VAAELNVQSQTAAEMDKARASTESDIAQDTAKRLKAAAHRVPIWITDGWCPM
jgi:hypothetical protein